MSNASTKRTRSARVTPPGQLARLLELIRRSDVLARVGLCAIAALLVWILTGGWIPPFAYRLGDVPPRNVVARTEFSRKDDDATQELLEKTRDETICVYSHDVQPLHRLRQQLKDEVFQIIRAESFEKVDKTIWSKFIPESEGASTTTEEQVYEGFKEVFADDAELEKFDQVLKRAFEDFDNHGLVHEADLPTSGSRLAILVHPAANENMVQRIEVKDVRIKDATETLRRRLTQEFHAAMVSDAHSEAVTKHVLAWLTNQKLPSTLSLNEAATQRGV